MKILFLAFIMLTSAALMAQTRMMKIWNNLTSSEIKSDDIKIKKKEASLLLTTMP